MKSQAENGDVEGILAGAMEHLTRALDVLKKGKNDAVQGPTK